MMQLSKFHVQVINFLLGPYTTHIYEPGSIDKKTLLKIAGRGFNLEIFYEINSYSKVYKRWWVPNSRKHVIKLTAELTGEAPERLKIICGNHLHLPYEGSVEEPSSLELYNASNFYIEFLTHRGLKV